MTVGDGHTPLLISKFYKIILNCTKTDRTCMLIKKKKSMVRNLEALQDTKLILLEEWVSI